jgi:hypothetical protein
LPPAAAGLAVQGGAGLAGDRGQAGIGGEFAAGGEGRAVADLGEDAGAGPRPDPWHGQQLTERVGQERLLDLGGEGVAAAADPVQFGGELGDHAAGGSLGTLSGCASMKRAGQILIPPQVANRVIAAAAMIAAVSQPRIAAALPMT